MEKEFDTWHKLKKTINNKLSNRFSVQEIWWCSLGVNIGVEEDGKNEKFERPVLVLRKLNNQSFIGLPLTSSRKDNISLNYFNYDINGVEGSIMLNQVRLISAKRLNRRMGKMGDKTFKEIKTQFYTLIEGENP